MDLPIFVAYQETSITDEFNFWYSLNGQLYCVGIEERSFSGIRDMRMLLPTIPKDAKASNWIIENNLHQPLTKFISSVYS